MFTPEDIIYFARLFLNGNAVDTSNFFMGVTSSYGLPYLFKINNIAAFSTFCIKIADVDGNDEYKQEDFRKKFYNLINSENTDKNEKGFLQVIKDYGGENGLTLYRGINNCNR